MVLLTVFEPVALFLDPARKNAYPVMNKVLSPDGTPTRPTVVQPSTMMIMILVRFEQDISLGTRRRINRSGFLPKVIRASGSILLFGRCKERIGREIVEEHLDYCLEAGINAGGINAEVATGQWEFQIFAKGAKAAGDQVWVAR